jgi:CubicO group peptidase (beta-lactamase class C family)
VSIPLDYERSLEITGPAGGGFSTLEDMTAYMQMYLSEATTEDGTRIVSETGLNELWTPQIDISADTQYGLGWFISEYKGAQTLSHPGNAIGYTSEFRFFPQGNTGMIILSNARAANTAHSLIFRRFAELIYEQPDETTEQFEFIIERTRQQRAELADQVQPIDPDAFATYTGTYTSDSLGQIELVPGSSDDVNPRIRIATYELPLRRYTAPTARDNSYIITLPPLAGLPFYFDENDNLVIEASATDYIFMPVD